MSTIYHKGGKSLPLPNPLYSVWNEMKMAPNKTMPPFSFFQSTLTTKTNLNFLPLILKDSRNFLLSPLFFL